MRSRRALRIVAAALVFGAAACGVGVRKELYPHDAGGGATGGAAGMMPDAGTGGAGMGWW